MPIKKVDPAGVNLTVEKAVWINRVAKVTKGAKRFNFAALVVVGDEQGHAGVGLGKAAEVPDAIRKAVEDAKKQLIEVPLRRPRFLTRSLGTSARRKSCCARRLKAQASSPADQSAQCSRRRGSETS